MMGEWKWFRENGQLMQVGTLDKDKKTGIWKRYHPNGAYMIQEYIDGEKSGEWLIYDADGKIAKTKNLK